MTIISVDNGSNNYRPGAKTLCSFKKYQIDVLGNYHEVKKEKRQDIKLRNTQKSKK